MAAGVQLGLDLLLGTGVDFCHQLCETKSFGAGMMPLLEHLQTHPSPRTSSAEVYLWLHMPTPT